MRECWRSAQLTTKDTKIPEGGIALLEWQLLSVPLVSDLG